MMNDEVNGELAEVIKRRINNTKLFIAFLYFRVCFTVRFV